MFSGKIFKGNSDQYKTLLSEALKQCLLICSKNFQSCAAVTKIFLGQETSRFTASQLALFAFLTFINISLIKTAIFLLKSPNVD